jgi:hypothetical protein
MATIINFPAAAASAHKDTAERPQGPAQILFFTGVRYERFEVKDMRGIDRENPFRMAVAARAATIDMNLPLNVPRGSRSSSAKDLSRSSVLNSLTMIQAGE